MPVDPILLAALDGLGVQQPAEAEDPVEQRKRAYEYEFAVYPHLGPVGPQVLTNDHVVPVEDYPDVLVRLHYPYKPVVGAALPVCLFFFGGAWRQGGLHHPSVAALCALRAVRADVVIAAVSYALAPEHPYPTALEQGYAVVDWLVREAESLGVDRTRVAVSGQSAGANLAAALTLVNRDRDQHPLALQILEVACLDLTLKHLDHDAAALTEEQLAAFDRVVGQYVPRPEDRLDPLVSPLFAEHFDGLPPAYIFTAEADPLRGDGEAYAAALASAGVPVAAMRLLGMTHQGGLYEQVSSTARAAQAAVAQALFSLHT